MAVPYVSQSAVVIPATRYELWLVEETDSGPATVDLLRSAILSPADFATDDVDEAKAWADAYNGRELVDPVGTWAVIRPVVPPAP